MEEYLKGKVELEFYGSKRADILRFLTIAAGRGILVQMAGEKEDGKKGKKKNRRENKMAKKVREKNGKVKDEKNSENKECASFLCTVSLPDFYSLEEIRRKTGVHYRVGRRGGLPFVLRYLKKRIGIPIGIAAFFLILIFLSQYLWNISFEGNLSHTDSELRAFLKEHQITEGIRTRELSCEELERLLRNEFFDITWVSCELSGTKLTVHIKENYEEEIAAVADAPYSLVAEKDAVITSIVTRNGTPLVAAGDAVTAGDALVSGLVTTYDEYGEELFSYRVNADADIFGETTYTYEDTIALNYLKKNYTGETARAGFVTIAGSRYTFFRKTLSWELYDREETSGQLKIGESLYLPLTFGVSIYREYTLEEAVYTKEEAKEIAEERYLEFLQELEENVVEIIKKDGTIRFGTALCEVNASVTVIERLGKVVPLDEIGDENHLQEDSENSEEMR
ncbi:MAG: sporulation protein YqfD [Lachnospiraceae bacterium]|nr:sporulation protein YqfD [Lachnospiraceae bacterium]